MKLWTVFSLFLLLCLIPLSVQQDYDDTRVVAAEGWRQGEEIIDKRDEVEEEETTKRPRRNGKRRKRLRKRLRTTEAPDVEDVVVPEEEKSRSAPEESTPDIEEIPKRRPGRRRKRPHRRYQDTEDEKDDQAPKAPRRRRKGGRKRIRPVEEENFETTILPEEPQEQTTLPTITSTTTTTTTTEIPITYKDVSENTVIKQDKEETTTKLPLRVRPVIKTEGVPYEKGFGNKIYDRRTLFSKSRKLPETSAILRRRFTPQKTEGESFNLRIINPLANLESNLDSKEQQANANEVTAKIILPEGVTDLPEIISPISLIEKVKQQRTTTEEPNYPKFQPKKQTEAPKFQPKKQAEENDPKFESKETEEQNYPKFESKKHKMTEAPIQETTKVTTTTEKETTTENIMTEKPSVEGFNSTLNDSIVELLKTDSSRISKILQERNMTLEQLLQQREKGSSQFLITDIFTKKDEKETTTEKMKDDPIQFPNQEVLGSFPKFLTDQIEKHTHVKEKKKEREPKVFESMPEFTTKENKPNWRIIPNPRFKPVSVQGDFEEIKLTNVISDKSGNDVDNVYLFDDNLINKNQVHDSLSVDSVKSYNTISSFKKIPVSVKSAIIISGAILALAIFGFLSVLISCRVRQKKARTRAKRDILCEHLQNEDFMTSQQSLSPVLNKAQRGPVFTQANHANPSNRHYYLWRTLRKTFQYD